MAIRLLIFLLINFGGLAIGGIFTGDGVVSDWYLNLNKAPWTPPGWVFGASWTTIMVCFSIYMAYLWKKVENKHFLIALFSTQWLLNVLWNPVFFYFHMIGLGLVVIAMLTGLIGYILYSYSSLVRIKSALVLPYIIWLIIATSLNAYIFIAN